MTFNLGAQITVIRQTLRELPLVYSQLVEPIIEESIILSGIDIKPYQERVRSGQAAFSQVILSRPSGESQEIRNLIERVSEVIANLPPVAGKLRSEVKEIQPDTPLDLPSLIANPSQSDSRFDFDGIIWTYFDLFQRSGSPLYAPFFINLGESLVIADFTKKNGSGNKRAKIDLLLMQLFVLQEGLEMISTPVSQGRPGIRYTVKVFDNLPVLSQRFYNTTDRWREIAEANQLEYPYTLNPGEILIIPDVQSR